MTGLATRKELHTLIDTIPEQSLSAIAPLLSFLADEYWKPVIETDLTDEEHALIAESVKRYHKDPSSFVPLESIR
jgi:isoleucyl-tRNA synthetase